MENRRSSYELSPYGGAKFIKETLEFFSTTTTYDDTLAPYNEIRSHQT
ncbi:MAG: hypothetical protein ACFFAN_04855 [Promethearchaeota archaeon]